MIRRISRRFDCFRHVIVRNRRAFSTVYLFNAAEWECVSDRCFLQCGEWVMKNGENGVRIIVFAAGKARNGIAMRAYRRVFRLFSGLFDDQFLCYVADCECVNAFLKVGKGDLQGGSGVFEAVFLDFSALNVAQSNGRLPFHAFDVQEDVGVCGVRVE